MNFHLCICDKNSKTEKKHQINNEKKNRNHQFKQRHERDGDKCKHFDKRSKQLKYELLLLYVCACTNTHTSQFFLPCLTVEATIVLSKNNKRTCNWQSESSGNPAYNALKRLDLTLSLDIYLYVSLFYEQIFLLLIKKINKNSNAINLCECEL